MAINSFQLERLSSGMTSDLKSGMTSGLERRTQQEMVKNGMTPTSLDSAGGASTEGSGGFLDLLEKSVEKVNTYQVQSDTAIQELVAGRTKNVHEAMLAIERADMSLKMLMQVRNKVLDAYREIMKMQV
jgi:flagellar hook-basal body complex protein FliE